MLRAGGGWSGELQLTDYEDLQEQESRGNPQQKVLMPESVREKSPQVSLCELNFEASHQPTAEGNFEQRDDHEIEDGDKKGTSHERFENQHTDIMRNLEGSCTTWIKKDSPMEMRRRDVTNKSRY